MALPEPGEHRPMLPDVAHEPDHCHMLVPLGDRSQRLARARGTGIVDEHDLRGEVPALDHPFQACVQLFQAFGVAVHGQYDADRAGIAPWPIERSR